MLLRLVYQNLNVAPSSEKDIPDYNIKIPVLNPGKVP